MGPPRAWLPSAPWLTTKEDKGSHHVFMGQGWEEDELQPGSALGTEIPQMTRLNIHRVFLSCDIPDIQR